MHFSWFNLIMDYHYAHVGSAFLAAGILLALGFWAKSALAKSENPRMLESKLSIKGVFEGLLDFIETVSQLVSGEKKHFSVPIFAALFLILLINNLVGLIPGLTPATENINASLSIGAFSFILYNYYGFKEHKLGYIKHFLGPVILLAPLMLVIELISHFVRPFSLGLRLSGNMTGDHTVLGIFLDLVPIGVPVLFYFLAIFVCFMQAFVFTMLSMIYLSMSIAHDH